MRSLFQIESHWRGVGDPQRWAKWTRLQ